MAGRTPSAEGHPVETLLLHSFVPELPLFEGANGGADKMIERMSSGNWGLDRLLAGGFQRGSAYIVQGPPGAGKTILANQFCYHQVRAGGKALYVSLLAESHARMLAYIGGMRFFDEAFLPRSLQYVSAYNVLEREGLAGLLKLMQHEMKRHQACAVILDGIFVAQSSVSEADYRKFIHELQGVAGFADATLLILTHEDRPANSPEHTMVDGWIELRDELAGLRSYRTIQVHKHRGSARLGGKHLFRISEDGLSVFPRFEAVWAAAPGTANAPSGERISTGIAALDAVVEGGLVAPSATLVLGPTGSGKTTLGIHFLAEAAAQSPAVMLGLYENPGRIVSKAASIDSRLGEALDSGIVELIWRSPAENTGDEVVWHLLERVAQTGAKRVLVDGIEALRACLIVPERLPHILNALNGRLAELGASVLYTSETAQMHSPERMPSDEISLMVENVILLSYLREERALRRTLSVVKVRDSGFDPLTHEFHIGPHGIEFGPDPMLSGPAE